MPQVASEFVAAEGLQMDAEDLRFGLDRGFLTPAGVIDLAMREVERGSADPVLHDLGALLSDEKGRVPDLMTTLDDPERIHDPRESMRKWLYLQLKAAYQKRNRMNDPLAVVEEIYSDFEYPAAIASFVRYMPLQAGETGGIQALMNRWADYLDREHELLTGGTGRRGSTALPGGGGARQVE